MNESSPRAVLNTLIETCKDAERGLLHAAELVTDPALKIFFTDTAHRRAKFATATPASRPAPGRRNDGRWDDRRDDSPEMDGRQKRLERSR